MKWLNRLLGGEYAAVHAAPDAKAVGDGNSSGGGGTPPIYTHVPGAPPIELVDYYPEFASYYPECELQTKRWFVENVKSDWTIFDAGANVGYYSILFSRL